MVSDMPEALCFLHARNNVELTYQPLRPTVYQQVKSQEIHQDGTDADTSSDYLSLESVDLCTKHHIHGE